MKFKFFLFTFFISIAIFSCKEKALETPELKIEEDKTSDPILKSATIYYVAKTGSDSNPGSSTSPFLTIQKAANIAAPGDVVIIRDGVYTTSGESVVNISRTGTSSGYITFKAENKGKAVLDGQSSIGYGIIISGGASYINIQDLEIKNFTYVGIHCNASTPSSYINIQGNKIHDIGRVVSSDGIGRCGLYIRMQNHHWNIDKNLIFNIGRVGPEIWWNKDHAIYIGAADIASNAAHDNTITYNIMFGCSGGAIQTCSNHDLIANNVIAWSNENSYGGCPFISVYPETVNLTVANNIFYQPPVSNPFVFGSQYGSTGFIVKNNIVYQGRMWETDNSSTVNAMKGNNYGRTDCEYPEVDPKFVSAIRTNAPNVDFSLQSTSPSINKGVDFGLTADFYSKPLAGIPDLGAIEYGSQTSQTTYYNVQVSATATKNDCATGYTGSIVTYTVNAGTYSSLISQADADSKAQTDLNNNKQAYANANGTCTASVIYYNIAMSATATKNDCGTGYTGSTVTYTVNAGKYSSTISQADANAKATTDLNNNKQAYANANGTCTPVTVYYYNVAMSATVAKNDCGTGYTGSTVTYTVNAGKYSSIISQADADSKAVNDLNNNKQSYANANGTCTAIPVYYNVQMSAIATKNDCGKGYKGSTVTYVVSAGKYSSTISQNDANAKASYDLQTNTQTYANTYGTCTRTKWWNKN